ncbi:unnamed protein product [Caenorhabditis bovis]|uniref:5'-AMP-activated protein kinase subunit beta-1 n=1 Tax=Caenorhabditis bovis TaxID=2654633 RepID=A0A8S1EF30_9PELO|nr:unnamed protein product [Caenorhabditis bovis]
MGNNQPGGMSKRERGFDFERGSIDLILPPLNYAHLGQNRMGQVSSSPPNSGEDECPVQLKIPKSGEMTEEFPVVFKWNCSSSSQPKSVFICGSWDNWRSKIPLVKSTSDFSTILELEPGKHEYKFMVDGKWVVDDNQEKTGNNLGGENNVITIDEADFEVFDALDKDLASSNAGEAMRTAQPAKESHDTPNDRELEKLHTFGQEIPTRADFNRASAPPVLPPHLLQVILNKDTPVQCDPNVLPEPDHVMLNHLYALSIKDGVMVLSATHRYRKKFVTTLLYKPI